MNHNETHSISPLDGVFLGLALVLAGIHFYLALFEPATSEPSRGQSLVIGAAFLGGFLVRLTRFWRPVLYLLGAAFAIFLGGIWILGGAENLLMGTLTGITATAFIALALYLFVREERRAVSE